MFQLNRNFNSRISDNENSKRIPLNVRLKLSKPVYNEYHPVWKQVVTSMDNNDYLKEVSLNHSSVNMNQQIVGGMPVIRNSRIPVSLIISCLRDGMNITDICQDYNLDEESVKNSLDFVIEVLDRPFHEE